LSFTIKVNTLTKGLQRYKDRIGAGTKNGVDFKAKSQIALQLLNYTNQGSANDPTVPPIKTGNLRGSGSVFIGSFLVQITRGEYGVGTPATSTNTTNLDHITIVYNTSYAAKLHESFNWSPGPGSEKSGDVGNKWLEKHLFADSKDLLAQYALILKRETGA